MPKTNDIFNRDYQLRTYFFGSKQAFTVEELYQEFKQRLMEELRISIPRSGFVGALVEKEELING